MINIQNVLNSIVKDLSDQNYEQSLALFRLWIGISQTYSQIPSNLILDAICNHRARGPPDYNFIYTTAQQTIRFVGDVESDPILAPHTIGLQSRFRARVLQEFFNVNLGAVYGNSGWGCLYIDTNIIAHYANLGHIEEDAIRIYILQSLISHPKLYDTQVVALVILFKIAGATFEAYADPGVVDRCFELLNNHPCNGPVMMESILASAFSLQKGWN